MSIAQAPTTESDGNFAAAAHRFTVAQYHQMIAAGVLTPDDRVELLEGVVIRMAPKGPWHVFTVGEVADRLADVLPGGWHIRRQDPITLADSEPEPDIVVARGTKRRYLGRHPGGDEVGLVVEVADTTLDFDRQRKSLVYAAAGIGQYWVVDLQGRRVHVLSRPLAATRDRPARYEHDASFDESARLELILDTEQVGAIAVAALLPPLGP